MENLYTSIALTFISTIVAILSLRPLAIRVKLVDIPSKRKKHLGNIPLIGGICLLFGLSVGLLNLRISLASYRFLFIAVVILILAGILDDFKEIRAYKKLIVQFVAAFIIVYFGKSSINHLGNLMFCGQVSLGYLSYPLTIVGVVSIINAINLIDGLDGLSGTMLLMAFILIGLIAGHLGFRNDFRIILLIISALCGFLFFNFPYKRQIKNKIFLGDVGSMVLGLLLAWFLIHIAKSAKQDHVPVSLLWIVALPLYDMLTVVIIRLLKRKKPFKAGREHFHYVLKHLLNSDRMVVLIFIILSGIFGIIGFISYWFKCSESWVFLAFLVTFLLYFTVVQFLTKISVKNSKT